MMNERVKTVMGFLWSPACWLLLTQLPSSHAQESLSCLNDFVNYITCIWDSKEVPPDTICTLNGDLGLWMKINRTCELKPLNKQNPALRGCNFVFEDRKFYSWSKIQIRVTCENVSDPMAEILGYELDQHIRMHPPAAPNVTNDTISWSSSRPFQDFLQYSTVFQLQYKQEEHNWEDVEPVMMGRRMQHQLNLEKGRSYQVRVRAGVDDGYKGEWSLWSPVTSWRSEVGREPWSTGEIKPMEDTWNKKLLIGCGAALLVILVAISITLPMRYIRVYKTIFKPVPNPSKYFEVLNLIHGGNFQKWLGPVFPAQAFNVVQDPKVSPVEVFSPERRVALSRKEEAAASEERRGGGQCSSFSNFSYFHSSYPHLVSPGGATEQGTSTAPGSIRMVSSYEGLQKLVARRAEPALPDSGIGVGSDDNDTEDDGRGSEAEEEWNDRQEQKAMPSAPSAFLPFILPLGKSSFHQPFPQHLSAFPHFPFPLPCKGIGDPIEPCSDEYMPVKTNS